MIPAAAGSSSSQIIGYLLILERLPFPVKLRVMSLDYTVSGK
jgi:hypothetical protein